MELAKAAEKRKARAAGQSGPSPAAASQKGRLAPASKAEAEAMVGTNVWDAELQSLKEEDRKWLQHNAFVIHVTKPLYV